MISKWRHIAAYGMAVAYAFVFVAGWGLHRYTGHPLGQDGAECACCQLCGGHSDDPLRTGHSDGNVDHRPDLGHGDRAPAKRRHGDRCRICRFLAQNFAPVVTPIKIFRCPCLHPAGTQFAAADGSVKLLAESIDQQVYHALCTRAAGDVVGRY